MSPRNPYDVARKLLDKYGLQDWQVIFRSLRPPTIGNCDYRSKTIRIDRMFIEPRFKTLYQFRQILLHEIAHALTPPHLPTHGKEWLKKAEEIGCAKKELRPYYKCGDAS